MIKQTPGHLLKQRSTTDTMRLMFALIIFIFISTNSVFAATRTSVQSGNWNNPACWSPSGVPGLNDDVNIAANHFIIINVNCQVHTLTVSKNGKISGSDNKTLNISGDLIVNGIFNMKNCDIILVNEGAIFSLGPDAEFTWAPSTNNSTGATLFKNGTENFNPSSTLIIERWYDYSIPLANDITGDFGNIVINSPGGNNSIVEWNQKNYFESHRITGLLTVETGWVTLDKSSSISNTSIGSIRLSSVNSTFIAHNGDHTSAFTLHTGSITNNGGNFYGLNDGNGNINLTVDGDFINSGNVKIINNSGYTGLSNGNAFIRIDGDYKQSSGDTRIIYNLSTTNSGIFTAAFKNLELSGGIFMGQNACHTGGRLNLLNITQDFTIQFNDPADKFRGSGLTSIGQSLNNAGLAINVGRNFSIKGTSLAEVTSSASAGDELLNVNGDLTISGCSINFNFGTANASHASQLNVKGKLFMNGGICCISKNGGKSETVIDHDLVLTGGTIILKSNSGLATCTIKGMYDQSGGTMIFHSNAQTPTNDVTKLQVQGNFRQSGGTLNFDDNASGAMHVLSLIGDVCQISGNGKIIRSGTISSNAFGKINYDKAGAIAFERSGNSHLIDAVNQAVAPGCEVILKSGVQVASYTAPNVNGFVVMNGGKLTMNNYSLSSNNVHPNCSVFADSSALISITNPKGLTGTSESSFATNINYSLHAYSIVEYRGAKPMTISGQAGNISIEKKYGILKLMTNEGELTLDNDINVRTRIELINGKIKLNNHTLTIESGNANAIIRKQGYIESEIENSTSNSKLCWKNITKGIHEFPFGRSNEIYLPLIYNVKSGEGNEVSILTKSIGKNINENGFSSLSSALAAKNAVDRWWTINANNVVADITFTFGKDENPFTSHVTSPTLFALQWSGTTWIKITPSSKNENQKTQSETLKNISNGSDFVFINVEAEKVFELKLFDAKKIENEVLLSWETVNESSSPVYTIEKSIDGNEFFEIGKSDDNITEKNLSSYNFSDNKLPESISYYRLKYSNNNRISYSPIKVVRSTDDYRGGPVKINSVSPNPFSSDVKINFSSIDERTMFEVRDAGGRLILKIPAEGAEVENANATLHLDQLQKGIYFLTVINNGKSDTQKIIKNE
jgi:hypothetical protein